MTDNYDLDPHEHPETHAEEGHAHESKAEAWPDDQPPVDDFADPGAEETATSSEETAGSSQEDVTEAAPRKSSSMLPIVAGIGGLLLVGAVLYWQFGRSSSAPIAAVALPPPLQMAQPASPPPAQVAMAPAAPSPSNNANAFIPAAPTNDVAPKTAMTPSAENPSVAMPAAPAPAAPSAVVAASSAPALAPNIPAAPEPTAPPTSFPAPSIAPAPSTTAAGESADARFSSLAARIDDMKKELDQINIALASPSSSAAGVGDRLTRIEQQLKQVEHASSGSSTAAEATPNDAVDLATAAPPSKPSYQSTHKKSRSSKTSHKSSKYTTQTAENTGWVLRAATPSEAWIAKDEESTNLRRVKVGDKLAGVGRVSAIRQVGDNWVIEGSSGTIH